MTTPEQMKAAQSNAGATNRDRRDVALAASQARQRLRDGEPTFGHAEFPVRQHQRSRLGEFDYKGQFAYHLVSITHSRRPNLVGSEAEALTRSIEEAAARELFELLVYCVMPDHVHVLALGTSEHADAVKFVQRFKQATGFAFRQKTGAPLWQQSFYDHVLRGDEDVLPIARYILGNPVEAGYVGDSREWKYCGGTMVSDAATALHSVGE